ncbi:unnamed protein product [Rangifer tarandus platyrhynchus]|uniref:Uncharacterized protein n=2 Tax=Rangifer tarandus platyrhynchus TaxID=3082113 RepID=A0ABN8Y980_RANTA|nr:unnamed protein product [Rangifer tarandus platyrhynchus]
MLRWHPGDGAGQAFLAGAEVSFLPPACVQSQRCLGTGFQDRAVPGVPSRSPKLLKSLQHFCLARTGPGALAAAGTLGWEEDPGILASSGESQLCHYAGSVRRATVAPLLRSGAVALKLVGRGVTEPGVLS